MVFRRKKYDRWNFHFGGSSQYALKRLWDGRLIPI